MLNKRDISANSHHGNSYSYAHRVPTSYWTRQRWFTLVVVLLILWVSAYFYIHQSSNIGYQYTRFSSEQVQQISSILSKKENGATLHEIRIIDDKAPVSENGVAITSSPTKVKAPCDTCALRKAMEYIKSEFGDRINTRQLSDIKETLRSSGPYETGVFLFTTKLKIKSYFWFSGPAVYLEAIFWTVIGVFCSILFSIGTDIKNYPNKKYSRYYASVIPYDVAKIFYAPAFSIVMLLAYNFIKQMNIIEVDTNEGMIVLTFVTGLFSGRVMSTIVKMKDILLPKHNFAYKPLPAPVSHRQPELSFKEVKPTEIKSVRTETRLSSKTRLPEKRVHSDKQQGPGDSEIKPPENIQYVSVEVKLNTTGLFEDERSAILKDGFRDATVTMHNVNGKDIVALSRSASTPVFTIANVKRGVYILRATLTQSLNDSYTMNLFGEKTVLITHNNNKLELYIKKYEALD